jgi:hypothetical protein
LPHSAENRLSVRYSYLFEILPFKRNETQGI